MYRDMEAREANEHGMSEQRDDLWVRCFTIAEKAIYLYAQGILDADVLTKMIVTEWERVRMEEKEQPSHAVLMRIAQRICSRELCSAWRSPNVDLCNSAFANLRRYLERSLSHTRYAQSLQRRAHTFEDVLHQTLEILHLISRQETGGPDDPASFLKWTQTILIRQAQASLIKYQREENLSLDEVSELFAEQFVDTTSDPLRQVLLKELQQVLEDVILSMRNQHYRQVLLYTYVAGVDERELARRLQVPVQDIYLWRHRALKALRNKPEVMSTLRLLLE
jgi:RNA polymerase sigma factor (sigma-70 family)